MNTYEAMLTRRSCKKFSAKEVPDEVIERIVAAGLAAPTGRNAQACEVIVIKNQEVLERISKANAAVLGAKLDPFYGGKCDLLVVGRPDICPTAIYDGSLMAMNLMLAAKEEGIESVWIHRAKEVMELEEGKKLLADLNLEGEYIGIANIIIGYGDGYETPTKKDRPGRVHYVK